MTPLDPGTQSKWTQYEVSHPGLYQGPTRWLAGDCIARRCTAAPQPGAELEWLLGRSPIRRGLHRGVKEASSPARAMLQEPLSNVLPRLLGGSILFRQPRTGVSGNETAPPLAERGLPRQFSPPASQCPSMENVLLLCIGPFCSPLGFHERSGARRESLHRRQFQGAGAQPVRNTRIPPLLQHSLFHNLAWAKDTL